MTLEVGLTVLLNFADSGLGDQIFGSFEPFGIFIIWCSGKLLSNELHISVYFIVLLSEIRLTFKGHAYVHWTEQHSTGSGKNRRTETRHYSASEYYFDQRVPVYGKGEKML